MKTKCLPYIVFLVLAGFISYSFSTVSTKEKSKMNSQKTQAQDSVLRHIVLFKFKKETTKKELQHIEDTFAALPSKISEIIDFEWGLNTSTEGLNKGFTHSYFLTFKNEEGLATYLPHQDHQAFVSSIKPYVEDVLVLDYWTK